MRLKQLFVTFLFITVVANSQQRTSTKAENVTILEQEFVFEGISETLHKIRIYLPPNYNETNKKYPVIYMHDGQNLFDDATSYIGEWGVDETLNTLFQNTGKGFIVVGIDNGGEARIAEYTPWSHEKYGGGKGELYIDFIVNTLKPMIDQNYRTKSVAKHTAIIGSSLGGLISYYGGLKYPEVFGKIGAISTSFWFSDKVNEFTTIHAKQSSTKLYLIVGGKEGEDMVAGQNISKQLLLKNGFKATNLSTKIAPEGTHSEGFWKSEFESVVTWLFNIN